MLDRLIKNWVYGGALAGALLLLLAPTLTHGWPVALRATFWMLPIYMLHQYEEHDKDRFRLAINRLADAGATRSPSFFVVERELAPGSPPNCLAD